MPIASRVSSNVVSVRYIMGSRPVPLCMYHTRFIAWYMQIVSTCKYKETCIKINVSWKNSQHNSVCHNTLLKRYVIKQRHKHKCKQVKGERPPLAQVFLHLKGEVNLKIVKPTVLLNKSFFIFISSFFIFQLLWCFNNPWTECLFS